MSFEKMGFIQYLYAHTEQRYFLPRLPFPLPFATSNVLPSCMAAHWIFGRPASPRSSIRSMAHPKLPTNTAAPPQPKNSQRTSPASPSSRALPLLLLHVPHVPAAVAPSHPRPTLRCRVPPQSRCVPRPHLQCTFRPASRRDTGEKRAKEGFTASYRSRTPTLLFLLHLLLPAASPLHPPRRHISLSSHTTKRREKTKRTCTFTPFPFLFFSTRLRLDRVFRLQHRMTAARFLAIHAETPLGRR